MIARFFIVIRKIVIAIWALVIVAGISAYLIWPEAFAPEAIARFLQEFQNEALLIYLLISIVRGFTLLPSTPLVLAGTMLFPSSPWLVLAVSMLGIFASSTLIYWFSELLGFDEYFRSKKPNHVRKIKTRLEHPFGLGFVAVWAFFPLVPTDAVCYVAGMIRMHFAKFIAAILIGEIVLCCLYIFGGGHVLSFFWPNEPIL